MNEKLNPRLYGLLPNHKSKIHPKKMSQGKTMIRHNQRENIKQETHEQIRITLIKHYYFAVHTLGSKDVEVKVKAEAWSLN